MHNLLVLNEKDTVVSLIKNSVYLVSIRNMYNVGALYYVQTGASSPTLSIITLAHSQYFTAIAKDSTSFIVSALGADGYIDVMRIGCA